MDRYSFTIRENGATWYVECSTMAQAQEEWWEAYQEGGYVSDIEYTYCEDE